MSARVILYSRGMLLEINDVSLLAAYSCLPTLMHYYSLNRIYPENVRVVSRWHENFMFRLLVTLSFLPILF